MVPPSELFGTDEHGNPRVADLQAEEGTAKRDIVLPVCYRNTPWVLTAAHAIGFGIYRTKGLVQFFDDPGLWQEIGYRVVEGTFTSGENVALKRAENSYPAYFADLLAPTDSISWERFDDPEIQYGWIAAQIYKNLTEDELKHTDILIVIPNAMTARGVAGFLINALGDFEIPAHLAGVTSSVDSLYQDGSVAISSIYRAKGNEAAMVYIVNSEFAVSPFQASRGRNVLFTAMTRSRAWVRICGCGPDMDVLSSELQKVREYDYRLSFRVPTPLELEKIRRIHRDMTISEITKSKTALKGAEQLLSMIESGELAAEALPESFVRRFQSALRPEDDTE